MTGKKMRRTAAVLAAAMVIGPLIPSAILPVWRSPRLQLREPVGQKRTV